MIENAAVRTRAGSRAFTLVEMLVVIAIIGILAGLLMPALTRARESGRQTACMNNLRQLGMAFQAYAKAFDEYFPPYMMALMNLASVMLWYFGSGNGSRRSTSRLLGIERQTSLIISAS